MIREAIEEMEGISFGGFNITDMRYADDAVLVADKKKKLQKMLGKLNETCKEWHGYQCYKDESDGGGWG